MNLGAYSASTSFIAQSFIFPNFKETLYKSVVKTRCKKGLYLLFMSFFHRCRFKFLLLHSNFSSSCCFLIAHGFHKVLVFT